MVDLATATVLVVWVFGIVAGFASYGLLFLRLIGWSWGEVSSLSDVTRYFLRADCGTFQITYHAQGTWWGTPWTYIKTTFVESWESLHRNPCTVAVEEEGVSLLLSWFLSSMQCCPCLACRLIRHFWLTAIDSFVFNGSLDAFCRIGYTEIAEATIQANHVDFDGATACADWFNGTQHIGLWAF